MKPKFTPGPWAVLKTNKSSPLPTLHSVVTEDTGDVIVDNSISEVPSEHDEGNAYLIAAAPELLRAVEFLSTFCDLTAHDKSDPAIAAVWKALDKARGK